MAFWKKTCKRCGRKIEKDFSYCPHCGQISRSGEEDYGFLGRNDNSDIFRDNEIRLPLGFNTVFKKLIKEMDKQFRELDREIGREKRVDDKNEILKKGGISINISGGTDKPIIKVRSFGNIPEFRKMEKQIAQPKLDKRRKIAKSEISEEKARKLAKLPREEAESKVRRLSGKIVYEIELPGVKDIRDIIVNQLENSIEIKAFSKDKAYFKFLPIKLPLLDYKFSKGKLTIELGER